MKFMSALAATALFCLLNLSGASDYEVALESEKEYCLNVFHGVHRNYNNIDCNRWR